ncbi:Rib/alpha-like domain-containing protein, partial [Escherichia coli]|uniref:Rib/alpha-like domain-containing protein n=1 Tax=Escherichia coli TaxID=562 RepID=UPI0037BD84DF
EIKVPVTVGEQPQTDQYDPEAGSIKKPYGEPTTEDEVTNEVTIPGYPEDGEQPTLKVKDPSELPDGNTPGTTEVTVEVTYPDGTKDEIKVPVTVGEQPQTDQYDPEAGSIKKPYGEPTTEDEVTNEVT